MHKKILTSIAVFVLTASMFVGCGVKNSNDSAYYQSGTQETSKNESFVEEGFDIVTDSINGIVGESGVHMENESAGGTSSSNSSEDSSFDTTTKEYLESQKLIYECSLDLQTLEFQKTVESIKELVKKYDGFIESDELSDNSWDWYYEEYQKNSGTLSEYIVIRIPTASYEAFLTDVGENGKVMNKKESVTNITKTYNDTSATIEVLEKEESLLLEMMEKSETITDMITVETRLSEVQRQLAIQRSSKSTMDIDIAYSTISIDIQEVMEYSRDIEEETFIQRVQEAFIDSFDNFLDVAEDSVIAIIFLLPYIVIAFVIIYLIVLKRRKRKGSENSQLEKKVTASNEEDEVENTTNIVEKEDAKTKL